MLLHPEIKKQIYTLKLSNKDTYGQIDTFLSNFALNEFCHLRSLTLTKITKKNVEQLELMLRLIPELYSFHLIDFDDIHVITYGIPIPKVQILSMSKLIPIRLTSSLINLTVSLCPLEDLFQLFKYAPMIKYLHIQDISEYYNSTNTDICFETYEALYLKQLIIEEYSTEFVYLEMFLKQTPNLKHLTLVFNYEKDTIDACRWENLIKSSLPQLEIFNFRFQCTYKDLTDQFKQFQSDFWHQQHHWYTEYAFDYELAQIYTIPFISNTYQLETYTNRYPYELINKSKIFDNVLYLTLRPESITDKSQHYFSNIISLTVVTSEQDNNPLQIQFLKKIVNLYNLKYLNVSKVWRILTSSILLEILKESPQLSSLTIDQRSLLSFFSDGELCKYLNKMVKKLNLCGSSQDHSIKKFCEIFSNIEQLKCSIKQLDDLVLMLNQLSKLSSIKVVVYSDCKDFDHWFKEKAPELHIIIDGECYSLIDESGKNEVLVELYIWIGRSTA